jgi:hypothetical protein
VKRRILFYGGVLLALMLPIAYMTLMPGSGHRGPLPEASPETRALAVALQGHVVALAQTIGERRLGHGDSLERSRAYIESVARVFVEQGRMSLRFEDVGPEGSHAKNVIVELPGASADLVIIGAHYDSADGAPGADDNASGVASTLEFARALSAQRFEKTVRFVLFANEEQPFFGNPGMGSLVHAGNCRKRNEQIDAMLSIESVGYYSDASGSQRYPWPVGLLYPDRGDFVAFVGDVGSRGLVRRAIGAFREVAHFPSEGAALPRSIPGVGWSDQWAFWQFDYPAMMVTDTAVFRNPHYHESTDTPATLDYLKLARVTLGLRHVIEVLAGRR